MADCVVLNTVQRRKMILGKVYNMQHELLDLIFKDSFDNKFNNFINLYESSKNVDGAEKIIFEVESDFHEKVYLKWRHGERASKGYPMGMRFPAYISYIKGPTHESEPHKIVDVDRKNIDEFVDLKTLQDYDQLVSEMETANIKNKLMPISDVNKLHDVVERIGLLVRDEFSRYSWVGGVFWGGKGFSYWGDWSVDLMSNLADNNLVDIQSNTGQEGYHAQRLCSAQFYKSSLVTNYMCSSSYENFRFSCPAFFMLKGDRISGLLEKYYRTNFVTTYKSEVDLEDMLKWQEEGMQDLRLWESWRGRLKEMEIDIKNLVMMSER